MTEHFTTYNYHAHTVRCQHATGTEREYIEAAIKMGIKKFGFSDHIPCPFSDGYVSGIRMRMEEAKSYVKEIRQLAEEYQDDIHIYVGFEAEYMPEFYEKQIKMVRELGCDYLIMGQHFWGSEAKGPYAGTKTREDERILSYVNSVIEGMKTGSYSYLAHPDLINYVGKEVFYQEQMTRLCVAMKEMQIPLEINVLGLSNGKHYPSDRFFEIAGAVGNDVVFGLDAHSVDAVCDVVHYQKCLELAKRHGLHLLDDVTLKTP